MRNLLLPSTCHWLKTFQPFLRVSFSWTNFQRTLFGNTASAKLTPPPTWLYVSIQLVSNCSTRAKEQRIRPSMGAKFETRGVFRARKITQWLPFLVRVLGSYRGARVLWLHSVSQVMKCRLGRLNPSQGKGIYHADLLIWFPNFFPTQPKTKVQWDYPTGPLVWLLFVAAFVRQWSMSLHCVPS